MEKSYRLAIYTVEIVYGNCRWGFDVARECMPTLMMQRNLQLLATQKALLVYEQSKVLN